MRPNGGDNRNAPGLSNKRIRSRLRAIYPYSLGHAGGEARK
jgi:hypothetical protein